ncbi:hypothetical protein TD95_004024 [Thielaviopsis punctulata]|uniref:BTB domain-containing protein n=1 Tax=Thielaviopsis punctulata TaxID=72032 RepID=A0A0F4ZG43_9PEZI|nr:hypothetical protein TD95_004024 [Thielaviopsis punctulata]
MPTAVVKPRNSPEAYRPTVTRTDGQRPACLVNASVTYCGNNQIYAFGGFDQYTDEVYNHVLCLDLVSKQWRLVDNYGDIPGVRMGHTATLYQGDKLLVFGGENEHRTHLSDLIIFDLTTAHWRKPHVNGPIPRGRARHAAVLHEDKLFIIGGICGRTNVVLDDICFLDLKTFTWSRTWKFVDRFDHSAYIWNDRVWVYGGMSDDMDKSGDLWWFDMKGNPAFKSPPRIGVERQAVMSPTRRGIFLSQSPQVVGSSGYAANSRSAQVLPSQYRGVKAPAPAPGIVSTLKSVSGPGIPLQGQGTHFHLFSGGTLLDFQTPAFTITSGHCTLSAFDLTTFRWQRLAEGHEIYKPGYRWHYCAMNAEGTKAWLLGCESEIERNNGAVGPEEFLSDIMEIDLHRYGCLGVNSAPQTTTYRSSPIIASRPDEQPSRGLGIDLSMMFDQPPEKGSGADFVITALAEESDDVDMGSAASPSQTHRSWSNEEESVSRPIHVHSLILKARWPHFTRLYNSKMAEFQTKHMHIREPYTVVRAFLLYLYTDSLFIDPEGTPMTPSTISGMLIMANMYDIAHLRHLCVNRLGKEIDVPSACVIWYSAGLANEEWLRKRAAMFCLEHWGRVVRSEGFMQLPHDALVELSQEVDTEGRVLGGDEVEMAEGYGGSRYGYRGARQGSTSSQHTVMEEVEEEDGGVE